MIAALYVEEGGCYFGLPGVDPWDEQRDARLYDGPWPVVAHPPCERWSSLNNLVLCRYPHRAVEFAHGNDGGCFAAALAAVRRWGGVLEHPAQSRAWWTFDLPAPARGQWQRGICGGWSIEVDQAAWGHRARKRTWLYAYGAVIPHMARAVEHNGKVVRVYRKRNDDGSWSRPPVSTEHREITHRAARRTPIEFRDLLISIARSVNGHVGVPAPAAANDASAEENNHRVPTVGDATCTMTETISRETFAARQAK